MSFNVLPAEASVTPPVVRHVHHPDLPRQRTDRSRPEAARSPASALPYSQPDHLLVLRVRFGCVVLLCCGRGVVIIGCLYVLKLQKLILPSSISLLLLTVFLIANVQTTEFK